MTGDPHEPSGSSDGPLFEAMATLEPSAERQRAMRLRVLEAYEADRTSLLAEWIGLMRVRPLTRGAWLIAGAVMWVAQLASYVPWNALG